MVNQQAQPGHIRYETPAEGVARIVLARPEAKNAQGMQMTYELNAAFDRAALDPEVKVIVLAADGTDFSAGHDLSGDQGKTWRDFETVGTWGDFDSEGIAGRYAREREIYLDMCERWRNVPKPTIAQVQGRCIAGALMLAWVCDLIVASDDAAFQDPTVEFGVAGAEFFMHPWELGPRKAKEWLFTSSWFSAAECHERGMVNRVVARAELETQVLGLAATIARKPAFALKASKEAVNQAQDAMGRRTALQASFGLHMLTHAQNQLRYNMLVDPAGLPAGVREKLLARYGKPATPPVVGDDT